MYEDLGGSVQDIYYCLVGLRPSYLPECCLFLCLLRFFVGVIVKCPSTCIRAIVSLPTRVPQNACLGGVISGRSFLGPGVAVVLSVSLLVVISSCLFAPIGVVVVSSMSDAL